MLTQEGVPKWPTSVVGDIAKLSLGGNPGGGVPRSPLPRSWPIPWALVDDDPKYCSKKKCSSDLISLLISPLNSSRKSLNYESNLASNLLSSWENSRCNKPMFFCRYVVIPSLAMRIVWLWYLWWGKKIRVKKMKEEGRNRKKREWEFKEKKWKRKPYIIS